MSTNFFLNVFNWFVDNKAKSILFGTKKRLAKGRNLDIRYGTIHIKHYFTVTYFGCVLDENPSGKPTALQIIRKINTKLGSLYREKTFAPIPS